MRLWVCLDKLDPAISVGPQRGGYTVKMKGRQQSYWVFDNSLTASAFSEALKAQNGQVSVAHLAYRSDHREYCVFDDVDWDLWSNNYLLLFHDGPAEIPDPQGFWSLHALDGALSFGVCLSEQLHSGDSRFHWEFPAGGIQDSMRTSLKLRALLNQGRLTVNTDEYAIMDKHSTVAARLSIRSHSLVLQGDRRCAVRFGLLTEVVGRNTIYKMVGKSLKAFGQRVPRAPALLDLIGDPRPDYCLALEKGYQLTAGLPAEVAVRHMLSMIIGQTDRQVKGIVDDVDTEFLHDYRVYFRKARSLTALMKNVFAPAIHAELRELLVALAVPTNELRDLDVFLLAREEYFSLVPSSLWPGLRTLFQRVQMRRKKVHENVREFLSSKDFEEKLHQLKSAIGRDANFETDASKGRIGIYAAQRIARRYKKICRLAGNIHEDTADEHIHEIRIECKKLRYMLEFFAELYSPAELKPLAKQLKGLQNVLGQFNDFCVQQAFLLPYSLIREPSNKAGERHASACGLSPGPKNIQMAAAVSGLIAVLYQKQIEQRRLVGAKLKVFTGDVIAKRVDKVFGECR